MCFSLSPAYPFTVRSERGGGVVVVVVRLQTESDLRAARRTSNDRRPSTCLSQIISRAHVQMQKRACLLSQKSRALIGRAR
jgi:hypothetical protein